MTIPVTVYFLGIFALYTYLARTLDRFHLVILAGTAVNLIAPLVMADSGVSMAWCLLVLSFTPWLTVDRLRAARPRSTTRACFRASSSSRRRTRSAARRARARRAATAGSPPMIAATSAVASGSPAHASSSSTESGFARRISSGATLAIAAS